MVNTWHYLETSKKGTKSNIRTSSHLQLPRKLPSNVLRETYNKNRRHSRKKEVEKKEKQEERRCYNIIVAVSLKQMMNSCTLFHKSVTFRLKPLFETEHGWIILTKVITRLHP